MNPINAWKRKVVHLVFVARIKAKPYRLKPKKQGYNKPENFYFFHDAFEIIGRNPIVTQIKKIHDTD